MKITAETLTIEITIKDIVRMLTEKGVLSSDHVISSSKFDINKDGAFLILSVTRLLNNQVTEDNKNLTPEEIKLNEILDTEIYNLDFSVRALNCLKKSDIETLRDLTKITERSLRQTYLMGEKTMKEIKTLMESKGIEFAKI